MSGIAAESGRIIGLDVARGFAVMGILAMNIIAFAMPESAYVSPLAWGEPSRADIGTWAGAYLFVDSKMRGLFSMLFGASTLLVIEAAEASGRDPARTHWARMVTLALFGLLHYYLVWSGDILFGYAVAGLVLYLFRNLSVRALTTAGVTLVLLNALMLGAPLLALRATGIADPLSDAGAAYAGFVASFLPGAPDAVAEAAAYSGGYAAVLSYRAGEHWFVPFQGVLLWGAETLGLMLIGMALFRAGLLRGGWSAARLWRWSVVPIGFGLLGNLALLWWQFASGLDAWVLSSVTIAWSVPFDVAMSAGYAALAMGLAARFADSGFIRRIGAAGRAAFTNYIGTSIAMTTIFYGYGGGLYGEISRTTLYLFVIGGCAAMLLWSRPWLERFRYGPLEWLWRCLARGRIEQTRR